MWMREASSAQLRAGAHGAASANMTLLSLGGGCDGAAAPTLGRVGTHYFVGVDGDWADDPDALAAALAVDWPQLAIRPASDRECMAYDLELGNDLGMHADGRCLAFKRGEELVLRLAVWWRRRV